MNKLTKSLFLVASVLVFFGCTVQKKKGEIGAVKKFYHNTTARYNGFFNADVLLTESLTNLEDSYQDNYNKVLALYPWMANEKVDGEKGSLDDAAKKVSVVVNLHRVSDWTDDCYLLLGQTQFIKKSYEDAEHTFEFMQAEFSPTELAKQKKKAKKKASAKKKRKKRSAPGAQKGKKKKPSSASKGKKKKKRKPGPSSKKKKKKKKPNPYGKKKKKKPSSSSAKTKKPTTEKPAVTPPKEKKTVKTAEERKAEADKRKEEAAKKRAEEEDKVTALEIEEQNKYFKHRPVWQDGRLWLAKTYIEREMYPEAGYILDDMESSPKTYKEIKKELTKTRAQFFLKQKLYAEAVDPLEKTLGVSKDRTEKARITYILGQLQQKLGNSKRAMDYFQQTQKLSLDYAMAFSAKLQQEQNGMLNGSKTAEQTLKSMNRMLKDDKNVDYKDQVYFAMGQIALNLPDAPAATNYFKQSLAAGSSNQYQQAESYLALAHLFNDAEDFVNAKNYFDSTLTVLPKSDERTESVIAYQENLEDIAANIEIVTLQDSLLRISSLSVADRRAVAVGIKQKQDSLALAKATMAINQDKNKKLPPQATRRGINVEPSTFFVYNDKSLKKGRRDFERKYGDRALEDNWRRSNRSDASVNELITTSTEIENKELTDEDIDRILKDVPGNPDQVKMAEEKIIKAMFTLGSLYRDRLERNDLSTKVLEELAARFPNNKHEMESWYMMYLSYTDLKNTARADHWKNRLVENYPNSIYAQSIGDPDFLAKAKKKKNEISEYYNETYAMFVDHKYEAVSQRLQEANTRFAQAHELKAKFSLLNAMTLGNIQGKEAYISALKDIIAQYPDTEEQIRAREILRLLGQGKTAGVKDENQGKNGEEIFTRNSDEVHYFIVAIKDKELKLSAAKTKISDYHLEYHKLDRLRISNIYLGADTSVPILVIRRFKNESKVMEYYEGVQRNLETYLGGNTAFEVFALSQSNYRQVLKSKSIEEYRGFFQKNYL